MAARPERIVDAHVHLWDPARTDWYPYLSDDHDLPVGDRSGMARRFDADTYAAESAGWNVEKLVNVAAATAAHSIEETIELDGSANTVGQPAAIVGGITPAAGEATVMTQLDRQMIAERFRGVRTMGNPEHPVPGAPVLSALRDRNLVFDLMARTPQLRSCAGSLEAVDGLSVVVEHAGWPRSADPREFEAWKDGLRALAAVGERVTCKLSGLAMPLGTTDSDSLAPWLEFAIDTFGVDRCMFASNFPVDGTRGTFGELFSSYLTVVSGLGQAAIEQLFATTAERVYRC
jgi:predicted TIM-barrel fold metal-dependent hydrolase